MAETTQIFVTSAQLSEICGPAAGSWENEINAAMKRFFISDVNRAAAFLAQCAHESQFFTRLVGNFNYTSATRIRTVFSSRYAQNEALAESHVRNPEALANHVYKNRFGNRDEGDGWKYRDSGLLQLTFRANFFSCSKGIGLDLVGNPDLVRTDKSVAALSSAWFWHANGCNKAADACDFARTTKVVNGTMIGQHEREVLYNKALRVLRGEAVKKDGEKPEKKPTDTTPENVSPTPKPSKNSVGEKPTSGKSKYPHNKVYESPSGHLVEIDDSPGNERIALMHRSGTYIEMDTEGDITIKSKRDGIFVLDGDGLWQIKGDQTIKIDGQSYTKVGGNYVVKSDGDVTLDSSSGVHMNTPNFTFSNQMTGGQAKLQGLTVDTPIIGTSMFAMMLGASPGGFSPSSMSSSVGFNEKNGTLEATNLSARNGIKLGNYLITTYDVGGTPVLMYRSNNGDWKTFGSASAADIASIPNDVNPGVPQVVKDPITGQLNLGMIVIDAFTIEGVIQRPKEMPDSENYWLSGSFRAFVNNDLSISSGEANINGERAIVKNGANGQDGYISFEIHGLDWKVKVGFQTVEGTLIPVETAIDPSVVEEILDEGDTRKPRIGEVKPGPNVYIPLKPSDILR